jgi:hypothetical protein
MYKDKRRGRMMDTWAGMLGRCNKPYHISYKYYGARGIKVCKRWADSFELFLSDMGFIPEGCSLDRIDVNGDYSPENCKWSTVKEQAANRRTTIILTFDGVSKCAADWCREKGISPQVFFYRTKKLGLSNEVALSLPASRKTRITTMALQIK